MAFNFPANPVLDQEYNAGPVIYVWKGDGWVVKGQDGTPPPDSYTEAESDAKFVDVAGDHITGALTVDGTLTAAAALNIGGLVTAAGNMLAHGNAQVWDDSLAAKGANYVKFPNGFIVQWGSVGAGGDGANLFPIAFTAIPTVMVTPSTPLANTSLLGYYVDAVQLTQFNCGRRFANTGGAVGQATQPFVWIAVGF